MLGRHLGQSAGRTLRLWPVLALTLAALLGAALAANTASPLQAQTTTPQLSNLQLRSNFYGVSEFPLRPNFAPHRTEYTASVPNRIDGIDVLASASGLTLAITNDDDTSTPYEANLDLSVGYNAVTVTVTSADGNATNVYTVTVTRASPLPAPTDCPADTDWCATMVVGRYSTTAEGIMYKASGYQISRPISDLSPDTFRHGGTRYQVDGIFRSEEFSSGSLLADELLLHASSDFPHGTVLQVGDREFTVDSYSDDGTGDEVWDISGNPVDLTEGEYVTVSLKFPSVLVSNASHSTDASVGGVIVAQSFETGSHEQGYTLTEVQIALEGDPSRQARVRIREDDGGEPATGTQLANFSNPATLTTESLNTFTAPEGLRLDPDTTYWITMGEEVVVDERVPTGRTTNIGQTGKTGWSMGDEALERTNGSSPWSASGQIPVMSINGFPRINSPATGAPVIEGAPVWGFTLEAHTRTIRDADGKKQGGCRRCGLRLHLPVGAGGRRRRVEPGGDCGSHGENLHGDHCGHR